MVETPNVKAIFGSISLLLIDIKNKKGKSILVNQFSNCVNQTYSSSDFLSVISDIQKKYSRNKNYFW